ncbi:PorP/SprF family type IX secretion system membrane protein [Chitinophaga sp.]|uniref:PorP/SprF family type IX secretion system membrane protein n=1 Tax=Chitinophaga sp. TaxID=1869181 RepID=UPI002F95B2E1
MKYSTYIRRLLVCSILLMTVFVQRAAAQTLSDAAALQEPSATQYFLNQYLANPAMAGIDTGVHINAAHRRQWGAIEGAPVTTFFTADAAMGYRVGAGLHIFNDKAGLLNRTRIAFSYAYHLPLSDRGQQLHFGLSLALNMQRIDYGKINGDVNDPSVSAFNRRDDYFEAEYGMAYTDAHWTLQGSIPNIRSLVTGDDKAVDGGGIFYTAAAYRFTFTDGALTTITPKLAYRGIKGYDNILDAGVNIAFLDNVLNGTLLYHTSGSATAGIGVNIWNSLTVQAMYTTQTGGIKTYVDGGFEIGVRLDLFK